MSSINTSFSEEINFIHLSDTHLPDREDYVAWDVSPMQTARITIDQMTELTGVDFCVHTGDVCDVDGIGNRASYRLADQLFGAVKMPKYFVAGNHDSPEIMHDYLDFGQREHVLEHKNKTCYQFNKNGLAFFVLDARQGRQSVGYVDREQQDWLLERFLALSSDQKVVVFMHYPLFNQTVPWIQQKMLVKNAGEVHSVFKKFSNQLLAVFHGHIHSGLDRKSVV